MPPAALTKHIPEALARRSLWLPLTRLTLGLGQGADHKEKI